MNIKTESKINQFTEMEYDGDNVICVTHIPSGTKAVIDNDTIILNRILEEMKTRRKSLTPRTDYYTLEFSKSRNGISCSSLASVIYSETHNIPLNEIRKYHIRHIKSGEIEDCRKCNLYSTGETVTETSAIKFSFTNNNKYFELLLKAQNKVVKFDNNKELYTLLATPYHTVISMNRYRPQVRINGLLKQPNKEIKMPYLSVVAYACYHQGLTVDNHIEMLPEIMKYNRDNNLEVEHLNGDIFDNRKYNLALVKGSLNQSKKDIIKYITEPYICNVVFGEDNKFRMILGRAERVEDLLSGKLIILDAFEDVVSIMKAYKKIYPDLFRKENKAQTQQYLFREPIISETLATMPASVFTPYCEWLATYENILITKGSKN